ncbi:MAG: hypothetical protein ACYC6N_06120 [Pirellulaceae bacterium]
MRQSVVTAVCAIFVFIVAVLAPCEKAHRDGMLCLSELLMISALIWSWRIGAKRRAEETGG